MLLAFPPAVNAQDASSANPQQAPTELGEVRVRGEVENEPAYKADTATTGSKTEIPIRDLPQSISMVKEELIESQNAFSLRDALKNVSGLSIAAGEGGRSGDPSLCAVSRRTPTLISTASRKTAQYFRDTFFLERAEVLKGASSILFGRGATGGVINQISKQPLTLTLASIDLTYGSFDFKRATIDVGAAPLDKLALRLNALYQDADSFRDFNFTDRKGIAPALKFDFSSDTSLTLNGLFQEEDSVFDYGVPTFRGRPADVPIETFYGYSDDRLPNFETGIGTAILSHRFTPEFSVKNSLRYGDYERTYRTHLFGDVVDSGPTSTIARSQALRLSTQQNLDNQTDFVLKKSLFGFSNTLVFGAEFGREDFEFLSKNSRGVTPVSIFSPASPATTGGGRANDFSGALDTESKCRNRYRRRLRARPVRAVSAVEASGRRALRPFRIVAGRSPGRRQRSRAHRYRLEPARRRRLATERSAIVLRELRHLVQPICRNVRAEPRRPPSCRPRKTAITRSAPNSIFSTAA